jgi:hypothetical protein
MSDAFTTPPRADDDAHQIPLQGLAWAWIGVAFIVAVGGGLAWLVAYILRALL